MLDDRQKTIDERLEAKGVRLETRGERVCVIASPVRAWQSLTRILSSWRRVFNVLSSWRSVATIGSIAFLLTACTDYYQQFEDEYAFGKTSGRFVFDGQTLTDQRNDQTYEVVKVGNLYWMNRNLGFEFYHSHDNATNVHCPKSSIETCEKTGFLYPGTRLDNLCIDGWRLPSTEEWKEYYNSSAYQSSTYGKDTYSGYLGGDESLNEYGKAAYFWTNAETDGKGYRKCVSVTSESNSFRQAGPCHEQWKLAVRCVLDVDKAKMSPSSSSSGSGKSSSSKRSSGSENENDIGRLEDPRDDHAYLTMSVADKIWMVENLRYLADPRYCLGSEGNSDDCEIGVLYTWNTANYACPDGWHLPSMGEWTNFLNTDAGRNQANAMRKKASNGNACSLTGGNSTVANISVSVKPSAYQDTDRCNEKTNYKDCGQFFVKVVNNDDVDYTDLELRFYIASPGNEVSEMPESNIISSFGPSGEVSSAVQISFGQYTEDNTGRPYLPIFINGKLPSSGGKIIFQLLWRNTTFNRLQGGWSLVKHPGDDYISAFDGIDLTQAPYLTGPEWDEREPYTKDPYIPVYMFERLVSGFPPDGSEAGQSEETTCVPVSDGSLYYWTSDEDGSSNAVLLNLFGNSQSFNGNEYHVISDEAIVLIGVPKESIATTVRCVKD